MKPQRASAQVTAPAGFTGWWCERCDQAVTLPDELGSPARCPKCRKPTAVWIPPSPTQEVREWNASAPWTRTRPRDERAKELFAHMQNVVETPDLNPDLRVIEREDYLR